MIDLIVIAVGGIFLVLVGLFIYAMIWTVKKVRRNTYLAGALGYTVVEDTAVPGGIFVEGENINEEIKVINTTNSPITAVKAGNALFIRCLIITAITLGLLIPLIFVADIVSERSSLYQQAINNIARLWGEPQTVSGPVLVVPYEAWRTVVDMDANGKRIGSRDEKYTALRVILPKKVEFNADLSPQKRYRGIYNYVVYTTPVDIKGTFSLPDASTFDSRVEKILWEQAKLSVGVTDLKAIKAVSSLQWGAEKTVMFKPGAFFEELLGSAFYADISLRPDQKESNFSLSMQLNGSGGIYFTPVGEITDITITGAWASPSFAGDILPNEREISDGKFSAFWQVPSLSRTYPQDGNMNDYSRSGSSRIEKFSAGVELYETTSLYRLVERAVKYGILFIGMTFVAVLSFELISRVRLHMLQYVFIGIAMVLFYLVLLSLAEYIPFREAFIIASAVSILMNGLYVASALHSKAKGGIIIALLISLYGVLYALLKIEDYALLVGTTMVVIVISVLMFLTRNLSLYATYNEPAKVK